MDEGDKTRIMSGQTVLVTGASRGIGLAIAEALSDAGADVWLAATSLERLEQARAQLGERKTRVEIAQVDVTDRAACRAWVETVRSETGRLDVLVNAAGAFCAKPFLDYRIDDFTQMIGVNLLGVVNMMQAVLPSMVAAEYGRLINIASVAGKWGTANQSAYNASKHAVVGLTRSVALEVATQGVTVNAICPGLVETDMLSAYWSGHAQSRGLTEAAVRDQVFGRIPIKRLLQPAEIAGLAAYLASPIAGGITGQSILHDGGMVLV